MSQKNAPTLARCHFDKHGIILIFFGKQHPHTFKNDVSIQLSLSATENYAKRNTFSAVDSLVALKRSGCVGCI